MKKNKKILLIISIILVVILSLITISYGFGVENLTGNQNGTDSLSTAGNNIIRVIFVIGSITSVIVLVALGIKYMMGSVEERATYKKTMMPYLIGAILVFAASSIAGIVYNIADSL